MELIIALTDLIVAMLTAHIQANAEKLNEVCVDHMLLMISSMTALTVAEDPHRAIRISELITDHFSEVSWIATTIFSAGYMARDDPEKFAEMLDAYNTVKILGAAHQASDATGGTND